MIAETAPEILDQNAAEQAAFFTRAGETGLASLFASERLTPFEISSELAKARNVRSMCRVAAAPEIADRLVLQRLDETAAREAVWDYLADRSAASPIDATGRVSVGNRLSRAAWEMLDPQEKRDFIANGGTLRE